MEKNDLRYGCQVIQMQLDAAKEIIQSDYMKELISIIRSITLDLSPICFESGDNK